MKENDAYENAYQHGKLNGILETKKKYEIITLEDLKDLKCVICKHCKEAIGDCFYCEDYVQYKDMINTKYSCPKYEEHVIEDENDSPCCHCPHFRYYDEKEDGYVVYTHIECKKRHGEYLLSEFGCPEMRYKL